MIGRAQTELTPSKRQKTSPADGLAPHGTRAFAGRAMTRSGSCVCVMMTSSNWNIFRVTGPLCGEFTGPGEFPAQRPVTRSFDVFFDLHLNKRLNTQPWGWWFETPSCPLRRHRNVDHLPLKLSPTLYYRKATLFQQLFHGTSKYISTRQLGIILSLDWKPRKVSHSHSILQKRCWYFFTNLSHSSLITFKDDIKRASFVLLFDYYHYYYWNKCSLNWHRMQYITKHAA